MDAAGKPPNEVFTAEQLCGIRAMITAGGTPLGGAVMDMMPKLGAIVCYGTGYDGVDLAAAAATQDRGRPQPGGECGLGCRSRGHADAGGDAAPAAGRPICAERRLGGGKTIAADAAAGRHPGRRVGVYGMGEIGRKIAARVAAFETDVGYFSRSRHDVPYQYLPSLEALAEWCSVLMIAVRAGADTHHAVDADILQKLGKDGYVVNISRGSVIDQQALVAALAEQSIAGAGLDVYAKEPHAPDALTAFPNVVLTPHVGGHTAGSRMSRCRTA